MLPVASPVPTNKRPQFDVEEVKWERPVDNLLRQSLRAAVSPTMRQTLPKLKVAASLIRAPLQDDGSEAPSAPPCPSPLRKGDDGSRLMADHAPTCLTAPSSISRRCLCPFQERHVRRWRRATPLVTSLKPTIEALHLFPVLQSSECRHPRGSLRSRRGPP